MKTFQRAVIFFAANALLLGTMAYGQTVVKAEVPFAFKTTNASLPAGNYRLTVTEYGSGLRVVALRNRASNTNVLVLGHAEYPQYGRDVTPHLTFKCNADSCYLSEFWTSAIGFEYPVHPRKGAPADRITSIPLSFTKAD